MNWRAFSAAAPALAGRIRDRLDATKVALLGTVRADGWPRISPVEPRFLGEDLVFGVMRSAKASGLRSVMRDYP